VIILKVIFVFLFSFIICEISFCAESVPQASDIFANVIKSRQLILSGEIEIDSSYNLANIPDPILKRWRISFDASKIRTNINYDNKMTTVCLDCYSKKTWFFYSDQTYSNTNVQSGLIFYDVNNDPPHAYYIPDPRWFGYLTFPIELSATYQKPLEMYCLNLDRYTEQPQVSQETVLGIDCWKVDYKLSGITSYSLWISKSDQNRVVCAESRFVEESEKVLFIDRMESETEKIKGEFWFPVKLKYRRTENGKITEDYEATIKIISLNEPLPPNTFSPKGVDFLKPETPVIWALDRDKPAEGNLEWDGEKIVPIETKGKVVAEPSGSNIKFRIFFVLLGIAMIFIGVGIKILHDSFKRDKND
jgi:hypothetical protein